MTRTRVLLLGIGIVLAAGFVLVGYTLVGPGGALVAFGLTWTGVLLGMRLAVPAPTPAPEGPARQHGPQIDNAAYPTFRRIETALLSAPRSARDYDIKARRVLNRIAVSRVVASHAVTEDEAWRVVREHVGEDLWPWVRPAWPPSGDAEHGGVDDRTLRAMVERLEAL